MKLGYFFEHSIWNSTLKALQRIIVIITFDFVYQYVVLIISDHLTDDTNVLTGNIQSLRNTSTHRISHILTIQQLGVNMKPIALTFTVVLITLIPNNKLTIKAGLTHIWNYFLDWKMT